MKDVAVKEPAVDEKIEEAKVAKEQVKMAGDKEPAVIEEKEVVEDVEDPTDKILNNLTAQVQTLNIQPDESEDTDDEYKNNVKGGEKGDDDDDNDDDTRNKSADDDLTERGPNGGRPVENNMVPSNMMHKTVPFPVTLQNGQMFQCQQQQPQMNYQRNGNRRSFDESESYGQPQKFSKPQGPFLPEPGMLIQPQMSNFQFSNNTAYPMNNLSDIPKFQQQQQPQPQQQNEIYDNDLFKLLNFTTTTVKSSKATSGGQVTVQTQNALQPNTNNFFDFEEYIDVGLDTFTTQNMYGNISNIGNTSPSQQIDYTSPNFTEARRPSQDNDSGMESEGVGSPWSEAASPGNMYTPPPSVDSGYERSPLHESQNLVGMSPPKYNGAPSPMNHRATPSPAATSGYGSPGQPQLDDTSRSEFFNSAKEEELDLVNQVIEEDNDIRRTISKPNIPQQQSPVVSHSSMIPQTVQQCQQAPTPRPLAQQPVQAPPAQMIAKPTFQPPPSVATSTPQGIIIFQQQQQPIPVQSHLVVLPISTQQQQKPKQPLRKILPKIPTSKSSNNGVGTSSMSTSNGQTTATKSHQANKNINQTTNSVEKVQQNRQLMIARRTVANISRNDLRQLDDEGDTYLHIAVCKTDRYMVQALLERLRRENLDSLVDQENNKRQTPLYLAAFINQPVMVAMFISFMANVNVLAQNRSSDGMTTEVKAAIHVAASHGKEYLRTLQELLKAKDISINIVNNYGQTALHCAIMAHGKAKRSSTERISSIEIIQALIKAGADPSAQDKKSGKTPLMYAIEQKNHDLVETILKCVDPEKVRNVVKTQAFDGSSCIKIAEGLKGSFDVEIWNKLWNHLQSAANGSMSRCLFQAPLHVM